MCVGVANFAADLAVGRRVYGLVVLGHTATVLLSWLTQRIATCTEIFLFVFFEGRSLLAKLLQISGLNEAIRRLALRKLLHHGLDRVLLVYLRIGRTFTRLLLHFSRKI